MRTGGARLGVVNVRQDIDYVTRMHISYCILVNNMHIIICILLCIFFCSLLIHC